MANQIYGSLISQQGLQQAVQQGLLQGYSGQQGSYYNPMAGQIYNSVTPGPSVILFGDGSLTMNFRPLEHGREGSLVVGASKREGGQKGSIATVYHDGTVELGPLAKDMDDVALAFWAAVSGVMNGGYIATRQEPAVNKHVPEGNEVMISSGSL